MRATFVLAFPLLLTISVCHGMDLENNNNLSLMIRSKEGMSDYQEERKVLPEMRKNDVRRVDLHLPKGSIGDALDILNREFKINFIADAYSDEPDLPMSIKNATLKDILIYLSQLFQRNIVLVGDIYVFRHVKGVGRTAEELVHRTQYPCEWPNAGNVLVKKSNIKTRPLVSRLSLKANTISISNVAQVVGKEVNWKLRIDSQLSERRIYAGMTDITPGQFTESLTVLLQGNQQVTIGQSPEQKEADQKSAEEALDSRTLREKESAKIRGELEKLLTPEQFKNLNDGKEVPLKLDKLPKELGNKVIGYIKTLSGANNALDSLDLSRIKEFAIVFLPTPNAPGGALGVNGFLLDGREIGF